jgi:hypothetical protein
MTETTIRRARVNRKSADGWSGDGLKTVARYLPDNYKVVGNDDEWIYIEGEDFAGWTLEDYVIPRLASGLIWAEEETDD